MHCTDHSELILISSLEVIVSLPLLQWGTEAQRGEGSHTIRVKENPDLFTPSPPSHPSLVSPVTASSLLFDEKGTEDPLRVMWFCFMHLL